MREIVRSVTKWVIEKTRLVKASNILQLMGPFIYVCWWLIHSSQCGYYC